MNRLTFARIAAVTAVLAVSNVPALSQQPDQPQQQPAAGSALSLDFGGGSAAEYINAIRKASPNANIVVLGDLARISMAAVQLKNVDVLSALSVLDQLPSEQGTFVAKIHVNNVRSSQDMPDVYTVAAEVHDRRGVPGAMQTTVISMADLLGENLKSQDALTAIQTSLELIGDTGAPAQIKFHEETGLLICRGSPEQIESIEQVIRQLRERAGTLEVRAQNAMAEQRQANASREAVAQIAQAKEQIDALTRQVAEWRTKAELLEHTIEEHQRLVAKLDTELREAQAERNELKRDIAQLQNRKEPQS